MLLGWLNAVVNERLRYAPLGWTKRYEFSDADTQCAMECIDQWVDLACPSNTTHINPEALPWEALCTTLSQSLYGGRIANSFDQAALDSFIRSIFRVENYGYNATVAFDMSTVTAVSEDSTTSNGKSTSCTPLVTLPNGCGKEVFESWINSLPDKNSPTWLGLPSSAENQLQSVMGHQVLAGLTVLKGAVEEQSVMAVTPSGSDGVNKDKLLQGVLKAATLWLSILPLFPANGDRPNHKHTTTHTESSLGQADNVHDSDSENISPLDRFISREAERGDNILRRVRGDLEMIKAYCEGVVKSTNSIRYLFACFSKGQLPESWRVCYDSPPGVSIGVWVTNLAERCGAIGCNNHGGAVGSSAVVGPSFWLGGMFAPEAFITATRQLTAQMNHWSLEDLELYLEIGKEDAESVADTIIRHLVFECAQWSEIDGILLSSSLRSRLPTSRLRWRRREDKPQSQTGQFMLFPVYLDETRANLVVEVFIEIPQGVDPAVWAQRGVAIVLQSL